MPGMDDAAVVPGLVPGNGAFFLENNDRGARPRAQNFAGRRQADDPGANDCKIIGHWFGAKSLMRICVELAKLGVRWVAAMSFHSQASSTMSKGFCQVSIDIFASSRERRCASDDDVA